MKDHTIKKGDPSAADKVVTNTRIGSDKMTPPIYGGKYHISPEEYPTFLQIYYNDIIKKGGHEYLTETQLSDGTGACLVDLDFRFDMDISGRYYTTEHVEDMVDEYLEVLKSMFHFDSDTEFYVFIFEKPEINRVESANVVKDGIHMMIGLQIDHTAQILLRNKAMARISEIWNDFPIKNTWEDVFDKGISAGTTNWQLYGSGKPGFSLKYELTHVYKIGFDDRDDEITRTEISDFSIEDNIYQLSARYPDHPKLFFKNEFIAEYTQFKEGTAAIARSPSPSSHTNNPTGSGGLFQTANLAMLLPAILNIRNAEQLKTVVDQFLDSINTINDYELMEAYDYTMTLPISYYGDGSFSKWIRVGWALRNISDMLFIVWVAFSAQAPSFKYDIVDLYDRWQKFDLNNSNGLTKRSIMHWSKLDAPTEYKKVHENSVNYFIDQTLNNICMTSKSDSKASTRCGEFDIARVLHHLFKDEFVCVNIASNMWYQFNNHRWKMIDSGTTLRKAISNQLRDLYIKKADQILRQLAVIPDEPEVGPEDTGNNANANLKKKLLFRHQKIQDIVIRLGQTTDKKNIMTEAKDLFYDSQFLKKLDDDPYLLCFTNGVVDFREKTFRRGYPEDHISKCTNIEYKSINFERDSETISEITDFMEKLFPVPELRQYMWDHLASTMIGTSANQTFNMYIGIGQNGKSVLVSLMELVLGEYKGDVPLTLIVTSQRARIGGLSPELVALKGIRYAVMQEPSKGDRINEGIMKQITSGIDPIQARAPFMKEMVTFVPQFKLVVCANEFMEIKSQDHGTWRRIRVVDFLSLFTENPVTNDPDKPYQFKLDKHIKEKFQKWKVVFAALLANRAFETNGVVPDCETVMASSRSYQERQDYIAEFIRDKIDIVPGGHILKTELNSEFAVWFMSTYGKGGPSPKDVHAYMDKRFGKYEKNKQWSGVKIKYEHSQFKETIDSDDEDAD
jgi:P4 family phage/plasmid primase-like protien